MIFLLTRLGFRANPDSGIEALRNQDCPFLFTISLAPDLIERRIKILLSPLGAFRPLESGDRILCDLNLDVIRDLKDECFVLDASYNSIDP